MTPEEARQITDPLERQRVALAQLEEAREEWKRQAGRWSAVRAEAVQELKQGRTWAQVAELLGVSEPTAWNIAAALGLRPSEVRTTSANRVRPSGQSRMNVDPGHEPGRVVPSPTVRLDPK